MNSHTSPYASTSETPDSGKAATAPRRQLLPAAIGILVTSILHIIGGLFYFVFIYSQSIDPDVDPAVIEVTLVYCLYYGITMLYSLLLITGAFSMVRQGSYMWAMTVCILALVPLIGPCYVLAIPFGVWGILVLRRPEVRDSFARI